MRLICAAVLIGWSAAAAAEPRTIKDCAAIEESFSYNDCIAKFGPKANGTTTRPDPGAVMTNAPAVAVPSAAAPAARATGGGRFVLPLRAGMPARGGTRVSATIVQRRSNGRVFAEFRVGGAAAPAVSTSKTIPKTNSKKATAAPQRRYAGYGRKRYR